MSLYKMYRWNLENCIDGFWHKIDESEFLINPLSPFNTKWMEVASSNKFSVPFTQDDFFGVNETKQKRKNILKNNIDFILNVVLKDWKSVKDENENEIEFKKENALKFFSDLPLLAYALLVASLIKGQEVEKEEKKS